MTLLGEKNMKAKMPMLIVIISAGLLVWTTLLVNRVQRSCVDIGKIESGELRKLSLSPSEIDPSDPIKNSMIESHATVGGILTLSGINFAMLAATIIVLSRRKKDS